MKKNGLKQKGKKTASVLVVIIACVVAFVAFFDLIFTTAEICRSGNGGIIWQIVLSILWTAVIIPMSVLILLNTVLNHFVCRKFGRTWEILSLVTVVYQMTAFVILISGLLGRTSNEIFWTDLLFGVSAVLPNILTVFEVKALESRIKKDREKTKTA